MTITKIDIPLAYGPAFEGERVRKDDLYPGDGRRQDPVHRTLQDGRDERDRGRQGHGRRAGCKGHARRAIASPLGIYVQVAGRKMQTDFEPILERQIHHLINYAQGIMHIGQRDIAWIRVGEPAVEKGFTLKDIGTILHAKFHQDFGKHPGQGPGDPVHEEGRCGQADQEGQGVSTR